MRPLAASASLAICSQKVCSSLASRSLCLGGVQTLGGFLMGRAVLFQLLAEAGEFGTQLVAFVLRSLREE